QHPLLEVDEIGDDVGGTEVTRRHRQQVDHRGRIGSLSGAENGDQIHPCAHQSCREDQRRAASTTEVRPTANPTIHPATFWLTRIAPRIVARPMMPPVASTRIDTRSIAVRRRARPGIIPCAAPPDERPEVDEGPADTSFGCRSDRVSGPTITTTPDMSMRTDFDALPGSGAPLPRSATEDSLSSRYTQPKAVPVRRHGSSATVRTSVGARPRASSASGWPGLFAATAG